LTWQREAQLALESERRFRLVVEAAPNAMVMIRASGQIEMVNGTCQRL
jgi:PAS domain S-box-containing protein